MKYVIHVITVLHQKGLYLGQAEMDPAVAEDIKRFVPNLSLTPLDFYQKDEEDA